MAVEEINIDLQELASIATKIKSLNDSVKGNLDSLNVEISSIPNIWRSKSQESLNAKYKNLNLKRDDFYRDLNAYSEYLTNVAEEFGYTEKAINDNISSFQ